MSKTITISWLKLNSGSYALKGIRVFENNHAYDSTTTFREEDAKWLTDALGARSDVEISGAGLSGQIGEGYPEWARHTHQEPGTEAVPPLDWERASTALLRHVLGQLVRACENDLSGTNLQQLTKEANAALLATEAGTHYTIHEARSILEKPGLKNGKAKVKR